MTFTQEEQQQIQSWITERVGPVMRCFMCGSGMWGTPDDAVIPVFFETSTGRIHYMDGIPVLPFLCQNCGHTVFFSTGVMGLVPQPAPEAADAAEEAAAVVQAAGDGKSEESRSEPKGAAKKSTSKRRKSS
jgi:hypothetical protein